MSNKNIFKNIINSKNNSINDKTKQKSILDYFNKKCPQTKRNLDQIGDNSSANKCHKNEVNNICVVDLDNDLDYVETKTTKCEELDQNYPIDREEFIDLNNFLEINFREEKDKQIDVSVDENESNEDKQITGYYIYQNFRQMIDFSLNDRHFCQLFDENDLNVVQVFTCLSGMSQILFIRLFMRKRFWIRKNSIKYPEMENNLNVILQELVDNKYLLSGNDLSDLSESLDILDVNELKRIAKSLKGLNINGINTKRNIKNAIITYLNTCQPVFKSHINPESMDEILLKSIKTVLRDKCFRVNQTFCDVFERMFLLFSKPELSEDDFNTQISFEFFKIFKVKNGIESYPKYQINRNAIIYESRDDLVRYCQAFRLETQILTAVEEKNYDSVVNQLMVRAKQSYFDLIKENEDKKDSLLPIFLRRYTCAQTYIRCLSHCVPVLEQRKTHWEAVSLLRDVLLCQTIYCVDFRGHWFERLALNLDKHLKDPISSLEVIEKGLKDEWVRTGHRYALYIREKSIKKNLKTNVSHLSEFESIKYNETTIFGETIKYTINDRKNIFKTTDSNGDVTVMSVEDIAIKHYKNNGFTEGIHTESQIYHSILCLLFWDIIYMSDTKEVVDSFRYEYQRFPLDFNCDQFFIRRKTQINSLLNALKNMSETEMSYVLENSWNNNFGTISLINWQNNDIKQIKEIVSCFGSSIVTDICERLIKDFRHTRSGFPDLLVWTSSNRRIKAVEVKGPNDRPSTKQQLWLSFLTSIGVEVEICHVKANKSVPLVTI